MEERDDWRHLFGRELPASKLHAVYGDGESDLAEARNRLEALLRAYRHRFGADDSIRFFSAPGRVELGGNHTDHQHGRVLAAAVNLDTVACAAPDGSRHIRIRSQGYPEITVDLERLSPRPEERGSSAALVRGVAAGFQAAGFPAGGVHACVASSVPSGSGLSSSASFEILLGTILNTFFCGGKADALQIAGVGQYAENVFFGKPCGLMDQLACAAGGSIAVDFKEAARPVIRRIPCNPAAAGYALCIVNTGASHAELTAEYAAIPGEMKQAAAFFGRETLRDVEEADFWRCLPTLREAVGDRAVLRAVHFFTDNALAGEEARALEQGDFSRFLEFVNRSGESSARNLQNLSCAARPAEQPLPVAIALARRLLGGRGAVRVHGGGFAGTIQAYVPFDRKKDFRRGMEAVFGTGCCHFVRIRPVGGTVL